MAREQFVLTNTVPSRPPKNFLDGAPYEAEAIAWGRPFLDDAIQRFRPRCILALGEVACRVATGLAGPKQGISDLVGYVLPSCWPGLPAVPCFHPSFLRRGYMSYFSVLLNAIKLAVRVAREGLSPVEPPIDSPPPGYLLYPTEEQAIQWLSRAAYEATYIAYDIETNYSANESEAEEAEVEHQIRSIQFSGAPGSGIFLPWRPPFIEVAKRILKLPQPKLGWNIWRFDNPLLAAAGCSVAGPLHDLMWAWHHLQPGLPRGLQFAAGQCGWPWPWKHLSDAAPQFYGIVDVDVCQFLAR
jgi:hypothetical protein